MAIPSFQNLVLNSTTGSALNSYTPTQHDGKFVIDLLFTLQHHSPLTWFQNTFLFSVLLPGPLTWKLSFFNWLCSLPPASAYILPVVLIISFIALLFLLRKYLHRQLSKKEPLIYLELIFPASTEKSAYATEQLFTLLNSLARQHKLIHKLLKYKKRYTLEIAASKEEGIRYILGASSLEAPIIEKSLRSYLPGLKINKIADYLVTELKTTTKTRTKNTQDKHVESQRTGIIEVKLLSDFALPLSEHKNLKEHDPISFLTGQMTKLGEGEVMVFQAIVTPVKRSNHKGVMKHADKLGRHIYQSEPLNNELFSSPLGRSFEIPLNILKTLLKIFGFILKIPAEIASVIFNDAPVTNHRVNMPKQGDQILNLYEQELGNKVKAKISEPLFETSIRLLVKTDTNLEYNLRTAGFLASLESLASSNQSLVKKLEIPIIGLKLSHKHFLERKLSVISNPILSASELSDIYHFPHTATTRTEDLVKTKSQDLPAPLSFKKTKTKLDNIFATNSYGGTETPIGQTLEERRRHTYILGATGSGKTNLLSKMIYEDIINGKGVAVVDPHGDLVEKLLRVIPKERIKDVVWFAPDDDGFPIALNLLELPTNNNLTGSELQKQKSLITSSIISIIQKFYDAKFFGPRMEYVLRNTILTALETPEPTLQTILDLLTKTRFRKEVVVGLKNKVLSDYWIYEFEKLGVMQRNTVISPITNKIGGVLSSPINYNILSQTKSKIDFEDVLNNGKILLCDLSKGKIGEDESSFFGSLILAKIQLAVLARAHLLEKDRKDFYLYVDEFQNFATGTFSELVSEARKYHLAVIIAHQSISQIENRDIIKIILANVGTVICFKTANPEDEQFILPIFSPEVAKHEISNLPLYNFYMKLSVTEAKDTFLAQADYFNPEESEKTARVVIDGSRKRYGTKVTNLEKIKAETREKSLDGREKKVATKTTSKTHRKPTNGSKAQAKLVG